MPLHSDRQEKSAYASQQAAREGLISGVMTLIPSTAAVWAAMKTSPRFVKSTNWQSRTAIAIMPPLFMYFWASELKLKHTMEDDASKTEHAKATTEWVIKRQKTQREAELEEHASSLLSTMSQATDEQHDSIMTEQQLTQLYRQSVENTGVRIVPGDKLSLYHQGANFLQERPVSILGFLSVPTVAYILYGRTGKKHLQLQMMLMHTRVYGQFAVLSTLIGLMGLKAYMDMNGKFITQYEANSRIAQMDEVRQDLLKRLENDKKIKLAKEEALAKAHEEDLLIAQGKE